MPPANNDHHCHQHEIIEAIRGRLGEGDVTLATLDLKLDQIKEQTTKTNGRVTKLEEIGKKPRMNSAAALAVITCCGIVCTSVVSVARDFIESNARRPKITITEEKQ